MKLENIPGFDEGLKLCNICLFTPYCDDTPSSYLHHCEPGRVIISGCHVAMLHSDYLLHRRSLLNLFSFLHFCKYERGHSFFITKICPSKRAAAVECKHAANNPTNIATHELLSGTLQLLANQTQNIKTCQHAIASRAVNEPSRKIYKVEAPTSAFTFKTGISRV